MICRHWLRVNEANFSNIKRINYWMNIKRLSFSYLDYKLSCFTEVFPFFVQSWKTHISSVIKKHARRRCIASCVETAWNQHTQFIDINRLPMFKWVSERTNEWAQQSAREKLAARSKQIGRRYAILIHIFFGIFSALFFCRKSVVISFPSSFLVFLFLPSFSPLCLLTKLEPSILKCKHRLNSYRSIHYKTAVLYQHLRIWLGLWRRKWELW